MNNPPDRDGTRVVRVVKASTTAPAPAPTPEAERARRYRARKRGQDIPHRKPGPPPASLPALKQENMDLQREVTALRQELKDRDSLPQMLGRLHQGSAATLAARLLTALGELDPSKDSPPLRERLRELYAAIDERHDHWPEP